MCVVKYFIGLPCPGCGFLRACWEAAHLHWEEAFSLYPLWPLVLTFFLLFRRSSRVGKFFIVMIFIQWFIRLASA